MTWLLFSDLMTIVSIAFLGADDPGGQLGPAPRREDREEDLGEGDRGRAGGQGAVVAVQGDLEPAAHAGTVDGRQRREGQGLQPREHLVAALAATRACSASMPANWSRSAPTAKMKGLPVSSRPLTSDSARSSSSSASAEGAERGLAEGAGLGVVRAVVHRQDRQTAHAGAVGVGQLEAGEHVVAHVGSPGDRMCFSGRVPAGQARSQRTAAPMPRPMHMVVMPEGASGSCSKRGRELHGQPCAREGQRVPHGDGAAVGVDLVAVQRQPEVVEEGDALDRERLVHLDDVEVVDAEAGLRSRSVAGTGP
jgi:hypothetical protein